jgi:hypothetical protein
MLSLIRAADSPSASRCVARVRGSSLTRRVYGGEAVLEGLEEP